MLEITALTTVITLFFNLDFFPYIAPFFYELVNMGGFSLEYSRCFVVLHSSLVVMLIYYGYSNSDVDKASQQERDHNFRDEECIQSFGRKTNGIHCLEGLVIDGEII
jgi:hypothetical protein